MVVELVKGTLASKFVVVSQNIPSSNREIVWNLIPSQPSSAIVMSYRRVQALCVIIESWQSSINCAREHHYTYCCAIFTGVMFVFEPFYSPQKDSKSNMQSFYDIYFFSASGFASQKNKNSLALPACMSAPRISHSWMYNFYCSIIAPSINSSWSNSFSFLS